ncbi:gluzincin family metallopeptidase [Spongiimicrobium salis]|uniref:metalloprotease n=1 Tax=Spongiimicrobium salis TaxID=1667022 RepID=UPI00374D14A0
MPQKKHHYLSYWLVFLLFILGVNASNGQHTNIMNATLDDDTKTIRIKQEFTYLNSSKDTLNTIYFNDWNHAYSDKNTPLAKRFAEQFKKSLHLAKDKDRGRTDIVSVVTKNHVGLKWERTKELDVVKLELETPIAPWQSTTVFLTYTVKLPPRKYTAYGYSSNSRYYLKDWYLTPAVYRDGDWLLYSNKDLEDLYTGITNTTINFTYPQDVFLNTNLDKGSISKLQQGQHTTITGKLRKSCEIILYPKKRFTKHVTEHLTVETDIEATKFNEIMQGVSVNKISEFIYDNLGAYPHETLLVSEIDYAKNPLYGINQLPSFVRPYEEQFQFELKFLKTALASFLRETMFLDTRKEYWVNDALVNYLMIDYVDTYYPKQKLLGKLSKIWGVRGFRLAQLDFNDQYAFLYMFSARKNTDQSLITSNDSLIKFNHKIANRYKAGLGIAYLSEYLGKQQVDQSIKTFYHNFSSKPSTAANFKAILEGHADQNIDWFFSDYISSENQIDFKIENVVKSEDSIQITLKNKLGTNVPISVFGLQKDSVVSKYWFKDIVTEKTFTVPRNGEDKLVLNYDQKIPEFNQRDNWKTLNGGFLSGNKKLKIQFFRDAEDPYYNQLFYVPAFIFNANDGITPGLRITNKTLLERPFLFNFNPSYSFNEKAFVGSGGFSYRKYHGKSGFFLSRYSLGGSTFHFAENSRFFTLTPAISFAWRPDDLISNERQSLIFRWVNIFRNADENLSDQNLNLEDQPDYSVINARFRSSNTGIIDFRSWFVDAQHSVDFSKIAFNWEYRKLFKNNRQLNLRFFAGKFLRNRTESDFFSFALDRPTDYLFDFNYLARSEDSGIYGQQIIIAEGGFKSQLENPFANDWLTTVNVSGNVWRWVELYGDVGLLKNRGVNTRFVYDSGVRLNFVTDFFELYFPVYSNNGWEIGEDNYAERIRFVVTLSPKTLIRLFNRKWF